MTGQERLIKTLRREKPDRVPISPFLWYNAVYEMFDYTPNIVNGHMYFYEPDDFDPIEKFVEYCDYFGFDVLHPLGGIWDLYTMDRPTANWEVTIDEHGDNTIREKRITYQTPEGNLQQRHHICRSSAYLVVHSICEYVVKTKRDFDIIRKYHPPFEEVDCSLTRRAKKATGEKGLASSCMHGAFNTANQLMKQDEIMMAPFTDEGFYRDVMQFCTDWSIARASKMIEAGADVIEIGANMAGSGVGPQFFNNFVREYEQQIIDAVHNMGAFLIYHNCGQSAKLLDIYNDMKIDILGYLSEPPYGDVDLDSALNILRPDMVLRGNIDQIDFMVKASPEQVGKRVMDLLAKMKKRGNFILSTTDFFFDKTPYDNIKAFVNAGKKSGTY